MDGIPILVKAEEHETMDDSVKGHYAPSEKHPGWMQLQTRSVQIPRSDNPSLYHVYAAEDIAGLKSALAKEKETKQSIKQKLADFDGIDINELREIESKYKDLKKQGGGNKDIDAAIKAAKEDLSKTHTADKEKWTQREQKLMDQLKRVMLKDKAVSAILKNKGNVDLLLPHVMNMMDLVEDGDRFETRVKNVDGEGHRVSMKADTDQTYMQPEEFVGSLKSNDGFLVAFEGSGASGSGSGGSDGTGGSRGGGVIRLTKEQMRDVKAYRRAKDESAKTGKPIEMVES